MRYIVGDFYFSFLAQYLFRSLCAGHGTAMAALFTKQSSNIISSACTSQGLLIRENELPASGQSSDLVFGTPHTFTSDSANILNQLHHVWNTLLKMKKSLM